MNPHVVTIMCSVVDQVLTWFPLAVFIGDKEKVVERANAKLKELEEDNPDNFYRLETIHIVEVI